MTVETVFALVAGSVPLALACGYLLGWWRRGREVRALESECARLAGELATKQSELIAALERIDASLLDLSAVQERAARSETQIEQLRDLVKVHVARRREFDEWAQPIRASLGDGVGQVMQKLKDDLARQEFSMRRQERIVAEAQDQYRGKRDELEQMRRELTLKNYHIAALNERFIRIEERMQDLATQVAGMGGVATITGQAAAAVRGDAPASGMSGPMVSPETERFSLEGEGGKDWMSVLDDWHRQLHQRFDRLEQLQARMRGTGPRPSETAAPDASRSGGGSAA